MKHLILCLITALFIPFILKAQQDSFLLYPNGVPGAIKKNIPERWIVNPNDGVSLVTDIQNPLVYVHQPAQPNGTSVLICAGGGYFAIAIGHEGHELAKWFNARGIMAFVLKYRLPNDELMTEKAMRPLQDAQQSMRIIRKNAAKWQIDPNKIGIMGFSAGGHLAATAGTHFNKQVGEITDAAVSVRPDFMILVYPLISFNIPVVVNGNVPRDNRLLGNDTTVESIREYSNELHVTPETPPTFMILAADDFISPQHDIDFFYALRKNNVPAELHIFGQGGHGFSLTQKNRGHVEKWDRLMEGWLGDQKLYNPLEKYEKRTFNNLPYRVLYPENYDRSKKYPLVLFLHGRGECGTDNEKQLVHGAKMFISPENRRAFPAIVLFPQCPETSFWAKTNIDRSTTPVTFQFDYSGVPNEPLGNAVDLVREFLIKESVDPSRVYVTGLSMGGMGTFEAVHRNPDLFAAAAPICGGGDAAHYQKKTRKVAFWVFHGAADAVVNVTESQKMVEKLRSLKGNVRYTEYPGVNHNSWDNAFADPEFLAWMFAQRKDGQKK